MPASRPRPATSGVCDARGLTGTLTATHHISIPAGTTLLWGQAELTISDTGTNDAVELAGDGSSLIGYQESGLGTVPRPDTSGYIACGIAGCTTVKNPNQATRNVDWVHVAGMYLLANGASSKVIDLTSVGHSRVQDNQITVGHRRRQLRNLRRHVHRRSRFHQRHHQAQRDQPRKLERRVRAPRRRVQRQRDRDQLLLLRVGETGQEGFVYAKDSNGNYPNNSLSTATIASRAARASASA